jgi:[acyl-carrier-protein] S-malonyltransferase
MALLERAIKGMAEVPFTAGNVEYHPKPKYGGNMSYSKYDLPKLVQTAFDGDLELLEKMCDREDPIEGYHHDLNAHYGEFNALQMAATNGQIEAVQMLLKAKADPHIKRCMPYGQDPDDGETAKEIAEKFGWADVVDVLKAAESMYPKGIYMRYGPSNNAKLYPPETPEGLDPAQEKRAKAKLKGMVRPLPSTKADFKYYGEAVFGLTHGYTDDGKVLRHKIAVYADKPAALAVDIPPPTTNALMFPGQGSQYVGMLKGAEDNPKVKKMIEYANSVLGYDLMDVCLNGPESKLEKTSFCQPAIYVASLAAFETLKSTNSEAAERPGCVAGLSLGEYTALTVAGVLDFEDGIKLVKLRGEAMEIAAEASPQGMVSVAGLSREKVKELCAEVSAKRKQVCQIANELFPNGFSCAGGKEAVADLADVATKAGALQARILKTGGAFHTPLMETAKRKLEAALKEVAPRMKPPRCNVYLNSTGMVFKAGSDPKPLVSTLCEQLVSPVLWETCVKAMISSGMTTFFEVGPMKQLKSMMKRIDQGTWGNTTNIEV